MTARGQVAMAAAYGDTQGEHRWRVGPKSGTTTLRPSSAGPPIAKPGWRDHFAGAFGTVVHDVCVQTANGGASPPSGERTTGTGSSIRRE